MNVSSCIFVVFQCKIFPTNDFPCGFFLVEYVGTWIVVVAFLVVVNIFYLLTHYHLQVQANSKKIAQKNQCYFISIYG